jgi:copper(I)-binding protein
MANRASRGLAALFAAALAASPAFAHDTKIGDLMLEHPHSRATPSTARTGAGYLTIRNHGQEADRLVAVACDCAETSEIHEMTMENNVMRMRELADGLPIPAGGSAELKPGGYHLMFIGLKAPFTEGEMVKATLTFEKAGSVDVMFAIGPLGGMKKGHDMKGSGHQGHGKMSN